MNGPIAQDTTAKRLDMPEKLTQFQLDHFKELLSRRLAIARADIEGTEQLPAAAIEDIEAALARMAEQCFGICGDCKEPMYFKHLLRYPTAKRCPACQRLYEIARMKTSQPSQDVEKP